MRTSTPEAAQMVMKEAKLIAMTAGFSSVSSHLLFTISKYSEA